MRVPLLIVQWTFRRPLLLFPSRAGNCLAAAILVSLIDFGRYVRIDRCPMCYVAAWVESLYVGSAIVDGGLFFQPTLLIELFDVAVFLVAFLRYFFPCANTFFVIVCGH